MFAFGRWRRQTWSRPGQADAVRWEYERLAGSYDRIWSRYLRRSIGLTLDHVPSDREQRILDAGCGTGLLLDELALRDLGASLVGLDLTRGMLAKAWLRLGERAGLVQGDASRLPFPDHVFDIVTSSSVLHYLHGPAPALREWQRVLRPGGTVVITDWCRNFVTIRVLDLLLRATDRAHGRARTESELRDALTEAGFTGVEVTRHRQGWFWGMMAATAHDPGSRS